MKESTRIKRDAIKAEKQESRKEKKIWNDFIRRMKAKNALIEN